MTNEQKLQNWERIIILTQVIYIIVSLAFIYQQKYFQATMLLLFGGVTISFSKNKNRNFLTKLINRMILGLATAIGIYWLYLKISSKL